MWWWGPSRLRQLFVSVTARVFCVRLRGDVRLIGAQRKTDGVAPLTATLVMTASGRVKETTTRRPGARSLRRQLKGLFPV